MDEKAVKLIIELRMLKKSFDAITKMWYEDAEFCDKFLETDYPFTQSFDELSSDVSNWVENIQERLIKDFEEKNK